MKITESNLQRLIELAHSTPDTLKDICHYEGMPTDWNRGLLNHRKNGEYIAYWCDSCGVKRHYNLTKLREIKKEQERVEW